MKRWYRVHKYAGMVSLAIFFLLCFSGLVIMVRSIPFVNFNQFGTLYTGESLWRNSDIKVQEILQENPNLQLNSMTIRPEKSMLTIRFKEMGNDGLVRYHFYNKNDDWVLANNEFLSGYYNNEYLNVLIRWLAKMHSNLGLGDYGRIILLFFTLMSLVTCVVGYFLHLRLGNRKSAIVYYSLHRVLGAIVAPYCMVLFISGGLLIGYSYFSKIEYSEHHLVAKEYFNRQSVEGPVYSYNEIFEAVKNIYPEKEIVSIYIPSAKALTKASSSTYYFRLVDKGAISDYYQGYLVADDVWVSAYRNNNLMLYEAVSSWYISWLAKGIDLHFKNHEHPILVCIWIIYLVMSCLLVVVSFSKRLRCIRFKVSTKYPISAGNFILTFGCLILPLYGPIGIYTGIVCGILSFILVGLSLRSIDLKR